MNSDGWRWITMTIGPALMQRCLFLLEDWLWPQWCKCKRINGGEEHLKQMAVQMQQVGRVAERFLHLQPIARLLPLHGRHRALSNQRRGCTPVPLAASFLALLLCLPAPRGSSQCCLLLRLSLQSSGTTYNQRYLSNSNSHGNTLPQLLLQCTLAVAGRL